MINQDLLSLLVCPIGKAPLRQEGNWLVCTRCGPKFEIHDEIPNMLIDKAKLPEDCDSLADVACVRCGEARLD